jgi:DNA gyrase/topoisomerase IV subunit A
MDCLVAAQERREEVFRVVSSAASEDEARNGLMALLDLTEPFMAQAVLDLQVRRWTQESRQRMQTECDELRVHLRES